MDYTKLFDEYKEERLLEKLAGLSEELPYHRANKKTKQTALILSYLFALVSLATASMAVFNLVLWMTSSKIIATAAGLSFLAALEHVKRLSSSEFWQVFYFKKRIAYGWLIIVVIVGVVSIGLSLFGTSEGVEEYVPEPELIAADSLLTSKRAKLSKYEKEVADLRSNKNNEGVTFYKLYPAINSKEKQISILNEDIRELEKKLEGKNYQLTEDYEIELTNTKYILIGFTLFFEILYELCIWFIWYFYFRSKVEAEKLGQIQFNQTVQQPNYPTLSKPAPNIDQQVITNIIAEATAPLIEKINKLESDASKHNGTASSENTMLPIGYFSKVDKIKLGYSEREKHFSPTLTTPESKLKPVQGCTALYRIGNSFVILHSYMRGNEKVTVPYPKGIVKGRVNQYVKDFDSAKKEGRDHKIIEKSLSYWRSKLALFPKE